MPSTKCDAMLIRGTNYPCCALFHSLGSEVLYRLKLEPIYRTRAPESRTRKQERLKFFWLCESCTSPFRQFSGLGKMTRVCLGAWRGWRGVLIVRGPLCPLHPPPPSPLLVPPLLIGPYLKSRRLYKFAFFFAFLGVNGRPDYRLF